MNKRAVLFANGECDPGDLALAGIEAADFIVCVDGGLQHCIDAGLVPHRFVGDRDSVSAQGLALLDQHSVAQQVYPVAKNASDLQLALHSLHEEQFSDVVLLGISGGRSDHMLFNWLLVANRDWSYGMRLIDSTVDAHVVRSGRSIDITTIPDTVFSVLCVGANADGVGVYGAQYPLENASIDAGSTIGLSNITSGSRLRVQVNSGTLLVMMNR